MLKLSRENAPVEDFGPVKVQTAEEDGYTANFVTFVEEFDQRPLLKGLPDDSCQCPHWGYVLKGRVTFQVGDEEAVFEAGDAFYVEPGHIPRHEAGTEYVQFSPSKELEETSAVIMQNMQQMQQS
jgi:hypothetical protein